MRRETQQTIGWAATAGAAFGAVAFAIVLVLDLVNPTFTPDLDYVLSATIGAFLAGGVLWWRVIERPGILTRHRAAAVGATVGFVGPTLSFALNPSVYGDNPNVLVDVLGGIIAAGILGLQGLVGTYGLPIALGALTGWSLAGWIRALDG